mgnify:CR=1 FL=1
MVYTQCLIILLLPASLRTPKEELPMVQNLGRAVEIYLLSSAEPSRSNWAIVQVQPPRRKPSGRGINLPSHRRYRRSGVWCGNDMGMWSITLIVTSLFAVRPIGLIHLELYPGVVVPRLSVWESSCKKGVMNQDTPGTTKVRSTGEKMKATN